jgi:hypothetical protein
MAASEVRAPLVLVSSVSTKSIIPVAVGYVRHLACYRRSAGY